jgi:alanyl-tRNA synthetase
VGDTGVLTNGTDIVEIYNTTKENNLTIHHTSKLPADVNATFVARVDAEKRQKTANNHSATHLLDHALRAVLGTHVEQKGSMVASDRLRFDFSHFAKVTDDELHKTERMVNEMIRKNLPLQEYVDVPIEEARERGAIALFGEKYGKTVRVIQFGDAVELCGGTHTSATGNIGLFKIISEGAVAAGVRRIEALTGEAAEKLVYDAQDALSQLKSMLNSTNLIQAVQKLQDDNQMLRKQMEEIDRQMAMQLGNKLMEVAEEINGILFMSKVTDLSAELLRQVALQLREGDNHVVVLGSVRDGKPNLAVAISTNLTGRVDAPTLVRAAGKLIQGGGGGHPTLAMAGGKNPDGVEAAVNEAVRLAKEKLQ